MPDFFSYVINNPFWAKGLTALVLLTYLARMGNREKIPVWKSFRSIAITLLATDFLSLGFPTIWAIPTLQNLGILFFYYQVLCHYRQDDALPKIFWVLGAATVLVGIAGPLLNLPWYVGALGPAVVLGLWIQFATKIYAVSEFNTDGAAVLLASRRNLIQAMIALQVAALILTPWGGYLSPLLEMLIVPVLTLAHTWTLSFWQIDEDNEKMRHTTTLEKNLGSLFEFMIAIGNAISEKLEMDKVLDFVVKSAVKATNADGGAIFLVDEFEDVLRVKAVEGDFPPPYQVPPKVKLKISNLAEFFQSTPIVLGKTIVGECAMARQSIYIRDTHDDPRMAQNAQLDQIHISSIILTPLMQENKVFGVLAVVSRRGNHLFSSDHYSQIRTFADYTSLTINSLFTYLQLLEKQEMEREVGIAAEIQGQLLPSRLPRVSSISLAAYSLPAKGVSGDYYDVINIRKGHVLCVVCDVAGKGIPASLVMVMIRTIIHLVAHQRGMTVNRVLDVVNWGIAGKVSLDRFATMALMSYDFEQHRLEYSNAAHHPLLIYRAAQKQFETLDTEGIPIGLERKTRYNQVNTVLLPSDVVVLYTDGIIEAMDDDGNQYSLEALQAVILAHAELPPERLKRAIIDDMNKFVGKAKQHDDQTFLLLKVEA